MSLFPPLQPSFSQANFNSGHADAEFSKLWQQAHHGWFSGQGNAKIHYSYWLTPEATAALLLVPGRIETGHKYAEFIVDALASGYQVFVLDHRGQGLSDRLQPDSQLGYVHRFTDYIEDLQQFIDTVVRANSSLPLLGVAHSMGGAILTGYLQRERQHQLKAAVFSSPMWGIHTGQLPASAALPLAKITDFFNQLLKANPWYLPGQGPYQQRPFLNNDLTYCQERYQWFRQLYQQYPAYQLGGVSWHWLAEALHACQQLNQQKAPDIPCFFLQAADDIVVDNQQQLALWQRWQQQQPGLLAAKTIPNARHELLNETDDIRSQWFAAVNQFLQAAETQVKAQQKQDRHE